MVVVHYFGALNEAALRWADPPARRRWWLLEDCVQSAYTEGVGERGDFAIASLRKWWAAPDGALVASREPLLGPDLEASDETFVSQRFAAKLLRGAGGDEALFLRWIEASEARLAFATPRRCSWLSEELLSRADVPRMIASRRQNWHALAAALTEIDEIRPIRSDLAHGETPLVYAVGVKDGHRDSLRAHLRAAAVFCPVHWDLEPDRARDLVDDGTARDHSRRMLSIPIDQRYSPADVQRVAEVIQQYFTTRG